MKHILTLLLLLTPLTVTGEDPINIGCYVKTGETVCSSETVQCSKTGSNMGRLGITTGALCDSLVLSESRESLAQSYIEYLDLSLRATQSLNNRFVRTFCKGKANKKNFAKCKRLIVASE